MTAVIFIAVVALLVLIVLTFVLWPLFGPGANREAMSDLGEDHAQADQREAALIALRDVEFEYRLGNLTDADYRQLRERYYRRAVAALRGRTASDALDQELEREIAKLRHEMVGRCPQCGALLAEGPCPQCGVLQPAP